MTLVPPGVHLAPVDLPPPPPAADPREPPTNVTRRSGTRTPQRVCSSLSSRDVSPIRNNRSPGSEQTSPLLQPFPRAVSAAGTPPPAVPIQPVLGLGQHLSRPSSPSSIHSSGSAIFERDIEQPSMASLSLNPNPPHQPHTLKHKPSRILHLSHGSPLDHTVPAVLDDAVEALTQGGQDTGGLKDLEIEAPAPNAGGMARPSLSSLPSITGRRIPTGHAAILANSSRSPSPVSINSRTSSMASPTQSPPILAQLSGQTFGTAAGPGGTGMAASLASPATSTQKMQHASSVARPAMPMRISTGPQLPGGWAFKEEKGDVLNKEPQASVPAPTPASIPHPGQTSSPLNVIPAHLSPSKVVGKSQHHRLSFVSYNDILLSIPTQVTSFGEITSGTVSPEHLPGTVSPSLSTRSPVISPPTNGDSPLPGASPSPVSLGNSAVLGQQSQQSALKKVGPKASWDGNIRGSFGLGEAEWKKEGLGKGLEQRLEDYAQTEN
ncbi:hypothetical protein L204_105520 [Cryptococcus depauperatus]|nr:hypothetical protein L204_02709 [Cryptococcus depauperatus CBS 7855]